MQPDDPRHGTEAGEAQHVRDGEPVCPACRDADLRASRRRSKRKQMGHRYTVSATRARERIEMWRQGGATFGEIADHCGVRESGVWEILHDDSARIYARTAVAIMRAEGWPVTALGLSRRVRALTRLGWSIPPIAEACGVHTDTILDLRRRVPEFTSRKVRLGVMAGYDALSHRLPEPQTQQEKAGVTRARNHAARMGWAAPLAWDDIDDPHEQPRVLRPTDRNSKPREFVDPVVVERVLAGDVVPASRAEKAEIVRRWAESGRSLGELERLTGWSANRYYKKGEAA